MTSRRPPGSIGDTNTGHAPASSSEARTLQFDGETLIYHLRTGEVHRLDRLGSLIWQFLDGQTAVDELVADLAEAFEADPETIRSHVDELLAKMGQTSLLAGGSAPAERSGPVLLTNPPSP